VDSLLTLCSGEPQFSDTGSCDTSSVHILAPSVSEQYLPRVASEYAARTAHKVTLGELPDQQSSQGQGIPCAAGGCMHTMAAKHTRCQVNQTTWAEMVAQQVTVRSCGQHRIENWIVWVLQSCVRQHNTCWGNPTCTVVATNTQQTMQWRCLLLHADFAAVNSLSQTLFGQMDPITHDVPYSGFCYDV
jgi:hypothetical protein